VVVSKRGGYETLEGTADAFTGASYIYGGSFPIQMHGP
jgi:hypothetical protein